MKEPCVRAHKTRGRNRKITRGEKGLGAETTVLQYKIKADCEGLEKIKFILFFF